MKFALQFFAVLLILSGSVFTLQGANVLPGSFMSGQLEWLIIGLVMVAIGGGIIAATMRKNPAS